MRGRLLAPLARGLFIAFPLVIWPACESQALEANTFFIAAANGYGVEDCLGDSGECGKAVADAWCAALGHGVALTYGRSDGYTAAGLGASSSAKGPYFVTCNN